jgi:hypothetical protein
MQRYEIQYFLELNSPGAAPKNSAELKRYVFKVFGQKDKHLYGIIPYLLTRHLVSTILLTRYGINPYKKKEENGNGYH